MPEVRHHTVRVPATSANLGPGFDAFGVALDRHLVVRSRDRTTGVDRVTTAGEGADEVATGDDNLIWRSFVAFCAAEGVATPDVALVVANALPLERGLGSSSAAIVAGLALGRALTGVAVADQRLVELADGLEGHPDNVAPAVLGGLVACARRDDGSLVVRHHLPAPHLRPVVLVPAARQSTAVARAALPAALPSADAATQAARAGHVLAGLTGAWPVDPGLAGDLLHEPARFAVMPDSGHVVHALRSAGLHAWLSGAGPSVAAAVPAVDPSARAVVDEVAARHGFDAWSVGFDRSGAVACPDDGCAFSGAPTCVQCPRHAV